LFVHQVILMRGKQAKILSNDNLEDLLLFAEISRHPLMRFMSGLGDHSGVGAWSTAPRCPSYSIHVSDTAAGAN
jgi:hypothetical protein